MEAPEPACPAPPARDQPAPTPGPPGAPSGQASPRLTLGPVILPPEQGLPPTMILKALPIPLYHTVPPGGLQPRAPLVTGSLDGGSVPFILSPLLQPEGPGPTQVGKPAAPALTVNIVGTLPVLSPGLGPTLGSPGKARNAGRCLCPHCGRDCLKPSVLEKHIRSHTGERPFPCATCGIAFKTQSNLYKHRRTQTHLNNSRLSLEAEGGGSSVLEEGDRAGEPSAAGGRGEGWSQRTGDGAPGRPLSPGAHLSLGVKNLDMKAEAAPCLGSTPAHRGAPVDSSQTVSAGLPLASTQSWQKLPEPKPCALQRQQEASSEKPWDARVTEGRLKKCESTDSGYLSRSDSAEQPPLPSSPLHSLSEHSAESEGEGGPGPGPGSTRTEPTASGASLELEKKRLEERIAQLISHNQAVVDDPQLDHVRPRKTVLSKQGSIDLPMPYTYKDSFHFDIRALEPARRRAAFSPACSTFTALDKSRPLFFHSVPTQLSTTVEYVPVTRSNSLPFVEGSRTWPEPRDLQDTCPRVQKPLSPRPAPGRLGCRSGLTLADVPSGHPRALVRQAAVEDVPCTPTREAAAPTEDLDGKRIIPGEGAACKGRAASKKCGQKKPKMFSQEKWQVYGNETFKRIYQKMKSGQQGMQKAVEGQAGHRTELDPPPRQAAAGAKSAPPSQDSGTPVPGAVSVEVKPGPWGSLPAPDSSLETESPKQRRTVARTGGSDQPKVARAVSSPTLGSRDPSGSGHRSPLLPPNGQPEPRRQQPPASGPLRGGGLGGPRMAVPDLQSEGGMPGGRGVKEACAWAPAVLRRPGAGSGGPWPVEDKLPSERKKLKVEGLSPQEQPGRPGAETPGSPAPAASLPSQKPDSDPGETAGVPHESAKEVADHLVSFCSSLPALAAAQRQAGLGDKEPTLPDAAGALGQHPQLAAQSQAPGTLTGVAKSTFAPKYLLRLPQRDTPAPPPVPLVSTQGRHSLCTAGLPRELGTPGSPGPASGPAPGVEDGSWEEPSCSRSRVEKKEVRAGRQKQEEMDTHVPASRESPGVAAGTPRETASLPPVSACDTLTVQDRGAETHTTCHPCVGSTSTRVATSGGVLKPQAPGWELQGPPEDAPGDPPLSLNPCCSVQPGSFLMALTRPQALPVGCPELPLPPDVGTPRSRGAQSPFPSLRAEPQLTWCCLRRSLPLPQEQKEKTGSVYLALHVPGGSLRDRGPDSRPESDGGRTSTGPREGGPTQTPKLSCLIVSGMRSQDRMLDPEWKKGLSRRRAKMTRGNSKQKKLRINPKRCEGNFWQSRAQLRVSRLRKPPWGPRRSCPPAPPRQASPEVPGLSLQGAPSQVPSRLSLGCGDEEEKEEDCRQTSETVRAVTSSRTIRGRETLTVKAISPSAGEPDDCSQEDTAVLSGLSLQSDTCLAVAKDDSLPPGKGLDVGLWETQLLPSQDQVLIDPKSCIFSDAQEPSSSAPKETSPRHDIATSAAAICTSLGVRADHTRLGVHSAEPLDHSWAAGSTVARSSPDTRATAEDTSQTFLPWEPSSGPTVSGLAPVDSSGKIHFEIPTSGPSSSSSPWEEGLQQQAVFPSRGQYGCVEVAIPSPAAGSHSGKSQVSGLITPKGCVVPSKPGRPLRVPEAPSKSIRKRSLEGVRKQTRVELSDTSSDDEDRLVIEI